MNKSSNKKELLIHAGYPRCASSFLQDKVFNNFKDIYYVNRNKEFRTLIKQFNYRAEFGENIREKYFNLFFPGLKNKAIVSDEQFIGSIFSGCSNASMILDKINSLGCEIKVIFIVRKQIEILDSLYRQYIKMGGTYTIEKFFDDKIFKSHFVSLDCFKYNTVISKFVEKFGQHNLIVLNYQELVDDFPNFINKISKFYKENNIKLDKIPYNKKVNQSLNNRSLRILRVLNKFVRSYFHPNQFIIPSRIMNSKSLYKLFVSLSRGDKTCLFDKHYQEYIHNYFIDDNKALYMNYKIDLK